MSKQIKPYWSEIKSDEPPQDPINRRFALSAKGFLKALSQEPRSPYLKGPGLTSSMPDQVKLM
jgi:hypothetical protein